MEAIQSPIRPWTFLYPRLSLYTLNLLTCVAFIVWLNRAYRNLMVLGAAPLRFPPTSAIWSWFVPFLGWVRPFQIAREVWSRSLGAARRPPTEGRALVVLWWFAFVPALLLEPVTIGLFQAGRADTRVWDLFCRALRASQFLGAAAAVAGFFLVLRVQALQSSAHEKSPTRTFPIVEPLIAATLAAVLAGLSSLGARQTQRRIPAREWKGEKEDVSGLVSGGRYVLSRSRTGAVRLWSLQEKRAARLLTREGSYAAVTPDGLAAVLVISYDRAELWDLRIGIPLRTTRVPTLDIGRSVLGITADRASLVGPSGGWTWDLETGGVGALNFANGGDDRRGLALTPDGKRAVLARDGGAFVVRDLATGAALQTLAGPTVETSAAAVTPDGKCLLTASDDGVVRVWDLDSGKVLHDLTGHTKAVNQVAISSDGRRALSASTDGTLRLWDLETGKLVRPLSGHGDAVYSVAFGPGDRWAVSGAGTSDPVLRVWDLVKPARGRQPTARAATGTNSLQPGSSPNGMTETPALEVGELVVSYKTSQHARIAAGGGDRPWALTSGPGALKFVDLRTGVPLRELAVPGRDSYLFRMSKDGSRVATASVDGWRYTVRVTEPDTAKELLSTTIDTVGSGLPLELSRDGRTLAAVSAASQLIVWNVDSGEERRFLPGPSRASWLLGLSSDGRKAFLGGSSVVVARDLVNGQEETILPRPAQLVHPLEGGLSAVLVESNGDVSVVDLSTRAVSRRCTVARDPYFDTVVSPSGRRLATGREHGPVRIWDLDSGRLVCEVPGALNGRTAKAFTSDGELVIVGGDEDRLQVWRVDAEGVARASKTDRSRLLGRVDLPWAGVCITPDGRVAAVAPPLKVWDLEKGRELTMGKSGSNPLALSPDGHWVVSQWGDSILVHDVQIGEVIHTVKLPGDHVLGLPDPSAISALQDRFLVAYRGRILDFDLRTGQLRREIAGPANVSAVCAAGTRFVATGGDVPLRVWDADSGSDGRPLVNDMSRPTGTLALSADGSRAVSGSEDGLVTVWDVEAGRPLRTLVGHRGSAKAVAISADGRRVVSGGEDMLVKVWDSESGSLVRDLRGHSGPVLALALSADGRSLVSAARDGTFRLWSVE